MSGHSKWANIKHRKGAADAKRGKIFTKLIKEITVATRLGGEDSDTNPRLRSAVLAAKGENMPKDNIERAIKKGTGKLEGQSYEEVQYEGYGPAGVAVLVDSLTDNKNRTVAQIRPIFNKSGGSMGEAGSVSWMFDKKGLLFVDASEFDEEQVMTVALEAGADDITEDSGSFEIITAPGDFEMVRKSLEEAKIKITFAEVTMIPQTTVKLEGDNAKKMIRLMETLEDNDDVQNVYANFDIPDSEMDL